MTELLYTHQGRQYTKAELEIILKGDRKPKAKSDGPAAYHKGYRVVGHKPGALALAKEGADEAVRRWVNTNPADRNKLGLREPKVWDEIAWRRNAPKTTIKQFALPGAADAAAGIARRDGWLDVDVIEMKKGEAGGVWS